MNVFQPRQDTLARRGALRLTLALLSLLLVTAAALPQQPPTRLTVINKTGTTIEVFVFEKKAWVARGRVRPGFSMPVYKVSNGQRFRAVWGSRSREHFVKLTYNRAYGGWQDTMVVP